MTATVNAHEAASRQTREELLAAGLRLLLSQPATAAFGHLTANKISTEAGRTSGAFFHQWSTLDAYLQDFIAYVLRPEMALNLRETVDRLLAGLARGATFATALSEAGRDTPEQTANDPQTVIELLMWNRALHDEEFRKQISRHYTALDQGNSEVYLGLMTMLGREARPPYTPEVIGTVYAALAQGLSLRASLTPGFYPDRTFGWTVAALIPLMTREVTDDRDAQQYVDDLPLTLLQPLAGPTANGFDHAGDASPES